MSFEKRRRSAAKYYYFSDRLRPRAKKRYLGSSRDPIVSLIALFHEQELEQLWDAQARIREETRQYRIHDTQHRQLAARVWRHFRVELLLQGYCLSQGAWIYMEPKITKPYVPKQKPDELTWDYVERLRVRANRGDAAALAELRRVIQDHPELWQQTGDILAASRESLLGLLAPQDAVAREAIRENIQAHRRQLEAEGHGTVLELLLIDHLMLTTLQVEVTRMGLNGSQVALVRRSDVQYWEQRHDMASKRFRSAAELLQHVRSVAGPSNEAPPLERQGLAGST